jgi:glucose/arabinose dehydrogenase
MIFSKQHSIVRHHVSMVAVLVVQVFCLIVSIPLATAADFEVEELAKVTEPISVVQPPGDNLRLFVLDRNGPIRILQRATPNDSYQVLSEPFLDLSKLPGGLHKGVESGALDLVLRPDFNTSGVFYARYYKDNVYQDAEAGWRKLRDDVIIRGSVSSKNANLADLASIREVFSVPKANTTHCGGWMGYSKAEVAKTKKFYLYASYGNDERKGEEQNGKNFYGKIIRIDLSSEYDTAPAEKPQYGIPDDNPFLGDENVRDEIIHLGLRNPWRCGFDSLKGDLWIGDVGGSLKEEVNFVPSGKSGYNFQWPILEGTVNGEKPDAKRGAGEWIGPAYEYKNNAGNSVIGGHVYRGKQIPSLYGQYFFTNYWAFQDGRFRTLDIETKKEIETIKVPWGKANLISSFTEGNDGEIYMCEHSKEGRILKVVPKK